MIRLDSPRRLDLVGSPILISGVGTGFEATMNWRVTEGHDEVSGYMMAGGGTGEHGAFQVEAEVGKAAFKMDRLFVEVFEASAMDGRDRHKTSREVLYGPRMVPGYYGYRLHIVRAGESLSSIARHHYGETDPRPIVRANLLLDDVIYPEQILRVPIGDGS
jgi:hypothetical protein